MKWTKPQSDAITARGGSVLVSAAAGSGKTAVLVERAVTLVCDAKNPVDADRLLIVTFSNAAAAEMKQRMSRRLSEMIRENPQDLFLQRQQTLLASAQISTIHSFCLELLRSNFQNLDISPDFSVADENELAVMKSDCVNACIERFYGEEKSGGFEELVELLAFGRDDARLAETILKIYDFSRSHPFFEDWLDEKLAMYAPSLPAAKTVWGTSILRYAADSLRFCVSSLELANTLAAGDEKMQKAYGEALRSDISQIKDCLAAAEGSRWDEAVSLLADIEFIPLKPLRGDDTVKERVKGIRARSRKICKTLAEKYLNAFEADFKADVEDLKPKITLLFALVKAFAAEFSAVKAEKRRLDFSDIEHLALKLLVQKTPGGYVRTNQAREIAARFDYVLVDEYQDTNEVQDLIFTSVSREQENLFMVGDVKQSIYAFRQAMPEIFMAKRQKFFPYDTGFFPAKINLDTNFRSRREVTCAVNFLFGRLMSEAVGDVDYNDEESLKCGASYPDYPGARPALLLVSAGDCEGARDAAALEAAEIAKHIVSMLESGYMVAEDGKQRKAVPRDFCILLRAPKNKAGVYVRELTAHGVPAWAENAGGYLSAREVSSVVCMLKAVDNPLLDIELAAAMLSPFFDFTDDDVANIRLKARKVPFYAALSLAAETDEKADNFLKIFLKLRALSAILPADRLIMRFYDMIDAKAVARSMPMGESRAANLQLLAEYAAEYHSLGYKQLGGFIAFLRRVEEKGRDLAPANTMGGGADVVRVMSVHHSKGLEFPIVFLADSAKKFNKTDLHAQAMLHSKYGFACMRRDNAVFKQFPTVPMQSIRLESERGMLSEELRVLYVALTRAREKLIIVATVKSGLQKKLAGLCGELENGKLAPYAVGDASSYADWVLSALLHHKSAAALRAAAGAGDMELLDDGNGWEIILRKPMPDEEPSADEKRGLVSKPDAKLLTELKLRTSYEYSYDAATKIPAKLAVSSVSRNSGASLGNRTSLTEKTVSYRFSARPKFMTEHALTAAEKGNAMHKFMQFADYENARNRLEDEIARMGRERFLSYPEIESLDRSKLRKFFKSKLAARIFAAGKVYRELKFMGECGRDILKDMRLGEEKIVLQGVADCVFIEDGGAVIVDYKTDRVKTEEELKERYESQISLYRVILGDNLGAPVKQCILYSFALSREISV